MACVNAVTMRLSLPHPLPPPCLPPPSSPTLSLPLPLPTSPSPFLLDLDRRPRSSLQRPNSYHAQSFSCQCGQLFCSVDRMFLWLHATWTKVLHTSSYMYDITHHEHTTSHLPLLCTFVLYHWFCSWSFFRMQDCPLWLYCEYKWLSHTWKYYEQTYDHYHTIYIHSCHATPSIWTLLWMLTILHVRK